MKMTPADAAMGRTAASTALQLAAAATNFIQLLETFLLALPCVPMHQHGPYHHAKAQTEIVAFKA